MDKKDIRVQIFNQEQYDADWPSSNLADAIDWFQEKLETIPPEYRHTAQIEIDSAGGYEGCHYGRIEIWYTRPETDYETETRMSLCKAREQEKVANEKATLRALQAKYGNI